VRRLLIVKTTSMGDVVHALPAVTDLAAAHPGLVIDWLVEAPFAAIPALHPALNAAGARVIPIAWRRWRKRLLDRGTWQAMGRARQALREARYDLVLDLQGLVKSAVWGRMAAGPLAGYDAASAREPLAAWLCARTAAVPRDLHAVQRCRRLAAAHAGHPLPDSPPDFGLTSARLAPASWAPPAGRVWSVLIPNASRPEKLWPETDWIAVGRQLARTQGAPIVLWGGEAERALAERIAAGCGGHVPPFLKVVEVAALLAAARAVVGLDTGFTHLAAAFGRPTVGIYCDHEPGLAGVTGPGAAPRVASLGGRGVVPARAEVLAALDRVVSLR
jgi:heptosyltransferase-1